MVDEDSPLVERLRNGDDLRSRIEAADEIEALRARIAELEAAIKRQARAAQLLRKTTLEEVQHLKDKDRSEYFAAKTLDSEREANAALTNENDGLRARIAELEEQAAIFGVERDQAEAKLAEVERERDEADILVRVLEQKLADEHCNGFRAGVDAAANRDRIERLMKSYHLAETVDEDGIGFPLIDALSCAHPTVAEGEKEIFALADHICGDILSLSPASPTDTVRQAAETLLEADEGLDTQPYGYCNGVAWSPGMMEDLRDIAAQGGE